MNADTVIYHCKMLLLKSRLDEFRRESGSAKRYQYYEPISYDYTHFILDVLNKGW